MLSFCMGEEAYIVNQQFSVNFLRGATFCGKGKVNIDVS